MAQWAQKPAPATRKATQGPKNPGYTTTPAHLCGMYPRGCDAPLQGMGKQGTLNEPVIHMYVHFAILLVLGRSFAVCSGSVLFSDDSGYVLDLEGFSKHEHPEVQTGLCID